MLRVLKIFCTLDVLYGLLERDNRLDGKFYFLFKQILYSKHAQTASSYAQGRVEVLLGWGIRNFQILAHL